MSEIELKTEEPCPFLGIRRSVHHTKLPPYFMEVFPKVMGWIQGNGLTPATMPMAMWHDMDRETGMCDVQAGIILHEASDGEGEIAGAQTVGGETLVLMHVGPYSEMGKSWGRVYAKAAELGREPGPGYEIYVDDPTEVAPEEMRTEIHLPLK